jgi:RNA polymerase sigma factor (sigma-70 family)
LRTPLSHTLAGVLSRIQDGTGDRDPELAARVNDAFAKHEEGLRRYCRKELRGLSPPQVDEIVQDVLLQAWLLLPTYRPEQPFRAFLWGIASLKCANARRRVRDVLSEDGLLEPTSEEYSVVRRLQDDQRDKLIQRASLATLDAADQELVHLRWVLDYPVEDVMRQLGFADANEVRVALQRCKRRLDKEIRRLLAELGHGDSFLRPDSRS